MATKKIIYLLAGQSSTVDERAEIAAIEAIALAPYSLSVRTLFNGAKATYGDGREEDCDYVAGTVPGAGFYHAKPVFDPDLPPDPVLPPTEAVVTDLDVISVANSAASKTVNGTAHVAANAVTNIKLGATDAVISSAQALVVPVTGAYVTTATVTVALGVVTGIVLS